VNQVQIMGIVNCTPDSFFDGGKHCEPAAAFEHALRLLDCGADILDIGGESTRPGYARVSEDEELRRVIPVIEMLHAEQSRRNFRISIDTTKAGVALQAVKAGADMINDISAMKHDGEMLKTITETGAAAVLQHTLEYAGGLCSLCDVKAYLLSRAELLLNSGGKEIYIDPGIGFGKTFEENIELIANIEQLCQTKFPVLLGVSRKSFIPKIAGLEKSDRLVPSVTCGILAAQKGVKILRVHDVLETKEALAMLNCLATSSFSSSCP